MGGVEMSTRTEGRSLRWFAFFMLSSVFLAFLVVSPSHAADFYWVDGSGTWNDANNWSLTQGGPGGAGIPGNLDSIFVTQSDAVNRSVDFTGFNNKVNGLSIAATGTGTMTFSFASGTMTDRYSASIQSATVNQSGGSISTQGINISNAIYNMSGGGVGSNYGGVFISNSTVNQTQNALGFGSYGLGVDITNSVLNVSAGGFGAEDSWVRISNSIINQAGGTIGDAYRTLSITNSTYNLSAGTLVSSYGSMSIQGGTVNQTGGTVAANFGPSSLTMSGIYNLSGTGVIGPSNGLFDALSISGTFNQTGGSVTGGFQGINITGTYNLEGGLLTLTGHAGTNNGTFNYSGGNLKLPIASSPEMINPFTNNGTATLSGSGTRIVDGYVLNNGTWKVTNTTAQYTGTFTNNGAYISDPAKNYFTNLTIGATGYLAGGAGDEFHFSGDFLNHSQNPLWDTAKADLFFGSGGHTFFLGDTGSSFAWDDLTLDFGATLDIEGDATLHVKELHLFDFSQLTGRGQFFYDSLVFESVPEPSILLLVGSALIGLVGFRRTFKA